MPTACRAADSLDTCPILPKQARSENGEYGPSTEDQSMTFPLSTDPSNSSLLPGSRPLMGKEALRPIGPMSQPEEDPERTKHSKIRALGRLAMMGSGLSVSMWPGSWHSFSLP